jgi:hypothetical protein
MRFCPGQASAEFALFARLRAARGTTHRQRFLLCDFHAYTMHGC